MENRIAFSEGRKTERNMKFADDAVSVRVPEGEIITVQVRAPKLRLLLEVYWHLTLL
jgi:hypothetical protein